MQRRDLLVSDAMASATGFVPCAFAPTSAAKATPWADQPAPIPPPMENVIRNLTRWKNLEAVLIV